MSEFAFSGVGINPHHGTPANPATAALDPTPRIPGGSTSGGAVSVAAGAAWAALGSDTGGSIRIPAALQGLVGFKGTARRVPIAGAVPLSTTLDTVCGDDALGARRGAAARGARRPPRRCSPAGRSPRCASPCRGRWCSTASIRPWPAPSTGPCPGSPRPAPAIETIDLPLLGEIASINASGGFAAAESWTWHRKLLAERGADYDPRVALRIRRGATMTRGRLHRAAGRAARLDRPHGSGARGPTTPCSPRPCRSSRRRSRRSSPATRPSSPPTACCCATPRSSTCSTAAPSACRATPRASCRSG